MKRKLFNVLLAGAVLMLPVLSFADEREPYTIVIKDHQFDPVELTVVAGEKIKLVIDNQDSTPEEFESHDLKREKIIQGNSKGTILIGPLEPGEYHFIGEFHEDTAKGVIIAENTEKEE